MISATASCTFAHDLARIMPAGLTSNLWCCLCILERIRTRRLYWRTQVLNRSHRERRANGYTCASNGVGSTDLPFTMLIMTTANESMQAKSIKSLQESISVWERCEQLVEQGSRMHRLPRWPATSSTSYSPQIASQRRLRVEFPWSLVRAFVCPLVVRLFMTLFMSLTSLFMSVKVNSDSNQFVHELVQCQQLYVHTWQVTLNEDVHTNRCQPDAIHCWYYLEKPIAIYAHLLFSA